MSESISIEAVRRGERLPRDVVRAFGEGCPGEFFRSIVEPLADSFDPRDVLRYNELMAPWRPEPWPQPAAVPANPATVSVLSRVTLGADVKITSIVLDAMKRRFPDARILLVGDRKAAELFAADARIGHVEANYPRTGPVSARVAFAQELRGKLDFVIDPDSRMTQLGLFPVGQRGRYFHFNSRAAGGHSDLNLTDLTKNWLRQTFSVEAEHWIAPAPVAIHGDCPRAAINLGVGDNDSKRIGGDFEVRLIRTLAERYRTLWVDRGAGGNEARRVTQAVEESGASAQVRYWESSFAGFASIVSQCDLYAGYDSAGQHAAAAAGTPLISIFAGASSERFRRRWSPVGRKVTVIEADSLAPDTVLGQVILNCGPRHLLP